MFPDRAARRGLHGALQLTAVGYACVDCSRQECWFMNGVYRMSVDVYVVVVCILCVPMRVSA
jgi:hypothetical protein